MIVRESPSAKVSPGKTGSNWPPKSPYEALLSSPSGRKRWQDRRDQASDRSPSPSPMRKTLQSSKALQALSVPSDDEMAEEDDDEETLQLELQAIEARLKLKKLQQAKQKRNLDEAGGELAGSNRKTDSVNTSPRKRQRLEESVLVPVSPTKDRFKAPQKTSPARVLLGIDKGWKAQDVSLKRANSAHLVGAERSHAHGLAIEDEPVRKGKTFSERLTASRLTEQERAEKDERIQGARGRGFGVDHAAGLRPSPVTKSSTDEAQKASKAAARAQPTPESRTDQRSTRIARGAAEHLLATNEDGVASSASRGKEKSTATDDNSEASFESYSSLHLARRHIEHTDLTRMVADKELYTLPRLLKEVRSPDYLPPDCESDYIVFGVLASKSSPYDTKPSHRTASAHSDDEGPLGQPKNKFMVLKITDLEWEVDVFLFDSAFAKYWKLTPGTVVAILNPAIMPPKTHRENGRFSLKLSSSEDDVLEIGTARDLSYCKSLKKDGKMCNAWINARKTEHCDFHIGLALDKTRASRMEVNTMFRFSGSKGGGSGGSPPPSDRGGGRYKNSRKLRDGEFKASKRGSRKDAETGERYYMTGPNSALATTSSTSSSTHLSSYSTNYHNSSSSGGGIRGSGKSTAAIMDAEDLAAPEKMRKRLAEKEREKHLAKKLLLGRIGNGIGAEYLLAGHKDGNSNTDGSGAEESSRGEGIVVEERRDAASLGLIGDRSAVRLSPVRKHFQIRATGVKAGSSVPVGWGGASKRGILLESNNEYKGQGRKQRVEAEKGQVKIDGMASGTRTSSPSKKKARFVLERKGIREPGRESLGDVVGGNDDDDDDDLDIV